MRLWLSSLGIAGIIGTGLYLSAAYGTRVRTRLDPWQGPRDWAGRGEATRDNVRSPLKAAFLLAGCLALACDPAASSGPPPPVNPFASAEPVDPAASRFSGRVVERLVAGSYVYLLVESEGRAPAWVVTAQVIAPDAERVHVRVVRRVDRFESRKLSRTFAPLSFGVVEKDSS